MDNTNISHGSSYPIGAKSKGSGVQFCITYREDSRVTLKVFDKSGKTLYSVNMNDYRICGNVCSVFIDNLEAQSVCYNYIIDGQTVRDAYAMSIRGKRKWGERRNKTEYCRVYDASFDWEGDRPLRLPFNRVIGYMMHVRGFTKHISSGVKGRGTFRGIIEKIPYLKGLGISQVELMPAYDFEECESIKSYRAEGLDENGKATGSENRINYWGFKAGSYFVPKPQYSYSDDSVTEFKEMVKALHAAGIELVMQLYFPAEINRNLVTDCLRFWVREYHIDGFHIFGSNLPMDIIATDPLLTDTKMYYERYDTERIFASDQYCFNRFLAEYNQDYMIDMRRFLKSDEDMLNSFLYRQRRNPPRIKTINHITSFDGFTLNDLVSYDYKHNEDNGEDNKDGTGYNYSWNCGCEGRTRKSAILKLRMKQLKNAFCLLMFSQGMPMIMAGDEFMNSQNGNNNPYCQDNETTWLNWNMNQRCRELHDFVRELIALRRAHGILRMEKEATLLDSRSCGFPDISYHAEMAWYPQMEPHIRHVGTMLCGDYVDSDIPDDYFYIATNMHWEEHSFALPKLPSNMTWSYCMDTDISDPEGYPIQLDENGNKNVRVPARTILVLKGKREIKTGRSKKRRNNKF
ncbi:MAG: hypothetical protein K6E53_16110 [Lachnospiraceae bacterium]|nr:hypothetical protein [Lachnospiraceae bacterium]